MLESYTPDTEILERLNILNENIDFKKSKGCSECFNSGYKGRIGIFELLVVDNNIKKLIHQNSIDDILELFKNRGNKFLLDDAIDKIKLGLINPKK